MRFAMRTLLGVVAGIALAFALVVGVEAFGALAHPFPPDFNGSIPDHVRRFPHWVLGVVVVLWSGTATAATWAASRAGNRLAGVIVALLLASGLAFNLTMLPYAAWFKIAMCCAFPFACLIGLRYGKGAASPAAETARTT